ncbi:MAG: hybrid sensor histidine kinase/response regulator [bacterium]|nr:hybrid sensor histidine kinase/response regulator [bacterium]
MKPRTGDDLTMLVVDDRQENLSSMRQLLRRPGLVILTAASGNEALGLMLEHDLALVLLDVQMPGMNGFEVAELMRRNERTRHVPIIFVTAIDKERRQVFSGYEAGAVDYLFKPVDPFIIRSKVAVFLEMKEAQLARERLVRELNRAYNRLQKLSDRKTDYLSAASHELRTPLTVIKEYCTLVHDGIVGEANDEQRHCMSVALRNCNRLATLVDDVLDLDAIEAGEVNCRPREVRLDGILNACRDDFLECCAARGQELRVERETQLPPVLADPALVTQILVNLLGNAHKFTPNGGVVTLRAGTSDGRVHLEVADTGPGIAPEDLRRVFDKFAQTGADAGGYTGNGLGLAISSRLATLLGGELQVESERGRGALFRFALPAYSAERHLAAFVADGTERLERVDASWTLVLLRTAEAGRVESRLGAVTDRVIRRNTDSITSLEIDGRQTVAVVLAADRDGAVSFLSRVEAEWERDGETAASVRYLVLDLPVDERSAFSLESAPPVFQSMGVMTG